MPLKLSCQQTGGEKAFWTILWKNSYNSFPQSFTYHPCLRKPIHPSTAPGHHLPSLIPWAGQTLQVPPEPQRKPTQFDKSHASALGHIFAWPLIQLQIPLHFLQPDADCTGSHFKKYNGKHHAGTGWNNSVMQVLNMDGSASYPHLSFFPWTPLSFQPQRFVFAGSMFPQYPCLLNSERPACGVGILPYDPSHVREFHMLESLIKSGNNC